MNAINGFQTQLSANPFSSPLSFNPNQTDLCGLNTGLADGVAGAAGAFGPLGSLDALEMMLAQMLNGQYPGFLAGQDPAMMQNYGQYSGFSPALGYSGGGSGGGGALPTFGGGGGGYSPSYSGGSSPSYGVSSGTSPSYSNNGVAAASSSSPIQSSNYSGSAGAGQRAIDIARSYEGQPSRTIGMDNYDAPGGDSNNCAAFVTGALKTAGKIDWTETGVSNGNLQAHLVADGWHQVPGSEAVPGDVKISANGHHTELVSEPGATKTIGSNNVREGYQVISERDNNPNSGTYWHKDDPQEVADAKATATAAEAKAQEPGATAEDKAKAEAAKSDVKTAETKADSKASEAKSADAKANDTKSTESKSETSKSSTSTSSENKSSEGSKSSSTSGGSSSGSSSSTTSGGSSSSSKSSSGGSSTSGGSSSGSTKA